MSTLFCLDVTVGLLAVTLMAAGWQCARLRRRLADALAEALHDPLTGLCNRRILHPSIGLCLREGQPFAAMILDVDRFKQINDAYGHPAGDAVLIELAYRLHHLLPAETSGLRAVLRLGGDEFAILVAGDDEHAIVAAKAVWRLAAAVPFRLPDGRQIEVNVSVGVASHRLGEDVAALLGHADLALGQAKQTGSVTRWRPVPELPRLAVPEPARPTAVGRVPAPGRPLSPAEPADPGGPGGSWRCWFDAADLAVLAAHAAGSRAHHRTSGEDALLQDCPGGLEIIADRGRILAFSTGWPPPNATANSGAVAHGHPIGVTPHRAEAAHLHLGPGDLGSLQVAADWGGAVEIAVDAETATHHIVRGAASR